MALTREGQAVEMHGLRMRVIAFYERSDEHLVVTILMSGGTLGAEVLKSKVALREGQSYAMRMAAGGSSDGVERFTFARQRGIVQVTFATEEPVRRADASFPQPGATIADISPDGTIRRVADISAR